MLFRVALFILLASSSLLAQARVGTTGASFIELSPSVRSNGMGEVGVALADNESFFFNPASLGLVDDHRVSLAGYPAAAHASGSPASPEYRSYSFLLHLLRGNYLGDNPLALSVAFQRNSLSYSAIERTYEQGTYEGTYRTFSAGDRSYGLSVGASYLGGIQVGAGATIRRISEEFYDYGADGTSFDFGGMVRTPLVGTLDQPTNPEAFASQMTVGMSFSHYGPGMKFIERTYPLPHTRRIGFALDAQWARLSLTAAVEDQVELITDLSRSKYGLEVGYRGALWGRLGHVGIEGADGYITYGGSVSARGLLHMLSGRTEMEERRDLFDQIDIRASYATSSGDGRLLFDGTDFFLFELVI